jgi:hypothetical protein
MAWQVHTKRILIVRLLGTSPINIGFKYMKLLQIIWTSETATIIANSTQEPIKGFDREKGVSTFEDVQDVSFTGTFVCVQVADGTEYGYPATSIRRLKMFE